MRRDVFQAIADPVRRKIIGLIAREQLNLNAIAGEFDISRPAISKHIRILEECGIVEVTQHGRERYCKIHANTLKEVADWVDQYRQLWEDKLDSFEAYLQVLKAKKEAENGDR